jgi:hypothetical protein
MAIISYLKENDPHAPINTDVVDDAKSKLRRHRVDEAELPTASYIEYAENQSPSPSPEKPSQTSFAQWSSTLTATVVVLFGVILSALPGDKA